LRAIIFANGILSNPGQIHHILEPDDLLIAADGGARHMQMLGLNPAVLIGDFDSLNELEVQALQRMGTQLIQHPARKDFTDLELAIHHSMIARANPVLILGALGNRWDQTLANLLLIASDKYRGTQISLLDGNQEIHVVRAGQPFLITGQPGDTVSLIPIYGDARGIITQNLEYPLHDETLYFASTRGVSNVLLSETGWVSAREGILMCVVIHTSENHKLDIEIPGD
jgi:thiamine pyrophosphokinase